MIMANKFSKIVSSILWKKPKVKILTKKLNKVVIGKLIV